MRLLITGRPGCGKTSLVLSILRRFPNRFAGFYTEEVREGGTRTGFTVTNITDGESALFASVSFKGSKYRVSKYGLALDVFERIGLKGMEEAIRRGRPILIDEIGKMELFSERFRRLLDDCLSAPVPLIATVHSHSHPFTDELKKRRDVEVFTLKRPRHREVFERIAERVTREVYGCPLTPVGVLRTPFKTFDGIPRQGDDAEGVVEVYEEFADALLGIETCSGLVLVWWMDFAERTLVGRKRGEGEELGVFALRSPNRPNPLGLTTVRLLSRKKNSLKVVGLDALDGSLLIDIKPLLKER